MAGYVWGSSQPEVVCPGLPAPGTPLHLRECQGLPGWVRELPT